MKTCFNCKLSKPANEYYNKKHRYCKDCNRNTKEPTVVKDEILSCSNRNVIKSILPKSKFLSNYLKKFNKNDIVHYIKNAHEQIISYALISYLEYDPIGLLKNSYCLDYIETSESYRGKGYATKLMNFLIKHYQLALHATKDTYKFFEHKFGLEKIIFPIEESYSYTTTDLSIGSLPKYRDCMYCGKNLNFLPKSVMRPICADICTDRFLTQVCNPFNDAIFKLNKGLRENGTNLVDTCFVCNKDIYCSCAGEKRIRLKERSCALRDTFPVSKLTIDEESRALHIHLCSERCRNIVCKKETDLYRSWGIRVVTTESEFEDSESSDAD